jgi:hypothetical protein
VSVLGCLWKIVIIVALNVDSSGARDRLGSHGSWAYRSAGTCERAERLTSEDVHFIAKIFECSVFEETHTFMGRNRIDPLRECRFQPRKLSSLFFELVVSLILATVFYHY